MLEGADMVAESTYAAAAHNGRVELSAEKCCWRSDAAARDGTQEGQVEARRLLAELRSDIGTRTNRSRDATAAQPLLVSP